jgi:peptidoglycan/xylan/chitin deacetylase (PgdA/CDA1 family)
MRAILAYHSVDDSGSPVSIAEPAFRRHVSWLATRGPRVVGVRELLRLPPHESAVALTFDDGFSNFGTLAWPVLRDHGLTATVYVPTDHAGGTNAWGNRSAPGIPTLPLLGWADLERLAQEGVRLGSHTCTHPHLTALSTAVLQEELERSANQLQARIGVRPDGLAYPYGSYDRRVSAAAAALYDHAVTADLRLLGAADDRHVLPRVDMYYLRANDLLAAWGTTRLRLYLGARAGARRVRTLMQAAGLA